VHRESSCAALAVNRLYIFIYIKERGEKKIIIKDRLSFSLLLASLLLFLLVVEGDVNCRH
jgi:hypothetical protein